MIIKKSYKEIKASKRKLIPIKKLKKLAHYTKKTYKIKTQTKAVKAFEEAFNKWPAL